MPSFCGERTRPISAPRSTTAPGGAPRWWSPAWRRAASLDIPAPWRATLPRMRRLALLTLIVVCAPVAGAAQQGLPAISIPLALPVDGRPFVVKLPDAVSADRCVVHSQQTGPAGGFGGALFKPVDRHTIEIPTGKGFLTLKAVVWCRGYQTAIIDVPSLETSSFQTTSTLRPQSTLRVTGRIQSDPGIDLTGQELEVGFDAPWQCFGSSECFSSLTPSVNAAAISATAIRLRPTVPVAASYPDPIVLTIIK